MKSNIRHSSNVRPVEKDTNADRYSLFHSSSERNLSTESSGNSSLKENKAPSERPSSAYTQQTATLAYTPDLSSNGKKRSIFQLIGQSIISDKPVSHTTYGSNK